MFVQTCAVIGLKTHMMYVAKIYWSAYQRFNEHERRRDGLHVAIVQTKVEDFIVIPLENVDGQLKPHVLTRLLQRVYEKKKSDQYVRYHEVPWAWV